MLPTEAVAELVMSLGEEAVREEEDDGAAA